MWRDIISLSPVNWRLWLVLAIALRLAFAALHLQLHDAAERYAPWGVIYTPDSEQYLIMAENLLSGAAYTDGAGRVGSPAARMPGYAAPYLLLRLTLKPLAAAQALVLLQVLLSGMAVWALADVARRMVGTRAFWITYVSLSALGVVAVWDVAMLTESLAMSALALGLWCLAVDAERRGLLIIGGLLFAWAFFLRPILAVAIAVLLVGWLWQQQAELLRSLRKVILVLLPVVLLEGAWVARNAVVVDRIVLTQADLFAGDPPPVEVQEAIRLVQAWGGYGGWWEANHEARVFIRGEFKRYASPAVLPSWALSGAYGIDSLTRAQRLMEAAEHGDSSAASAAERMLGRWREAFIQTQPLAAWVGAPLRRQWIQLKHPTAQLTRRSWADDSLFGRAYKLSQAGLYALVLLMSLLALVRPSRASARVFALAGWALLIVTAQAFSALETRHVAPALPLLALAVALTLSPRRPGEAVSSHDAGHEC